MEPKSATQSPTAQSILNELSFYRQKLLDMGVRKLGLFGSFVRGEQNADSDLDFVVVLEQDSFDAYMDVKLFLEDLFDRKVDLVPEDSIKPRLRPYVMDEIMYVQDI